MLTGNTIRKENVEMQIKLKNYGLQRVRWNGQFAWHDGNNYYLFNRYHDALSARKAANSNRGCVNCVNCEHCDNCINCNDCIGVDNKRNSKHLRNWLKVLRASN